MHQEFDPAGKEFRDLLLAACSGDRRSLQRFIIRYEPEFDRLIRKHLHPRVRCICDADDCLAMLWEKLFIGSQNDWLRIDADSLLPYVRRMTLNLVRNVNKQYLDVHKRTLRRETHFSDMPPGWKPKV